MHIALDLFEGGVLPIESGCRGYRSLMILEKPTILLHVLAAFRHAASARCKSSGCERGRSHGMQNRGPSIYSPTTTPTLIHMITLVSLETDADFEHLDMVGIQQTGSRRQVIQTQS